MSAIVSKYDIDWRVEVDWSSQGRTGTFVVDNNGQPFRTTSSAGATATCYWSAGGRMTSDPPTLCPR